MAIGAERQDLDAQPGTGRTGGNRLPGNFSDILQTFASNASQAGPALPGLAGGTGRQPSNSSVGNSEGGGLQGLFGASNEAIRESVETGFGQDFTKALSALGAASFGDFRRTQAGIKERQAGLGTRFGTDTLRIEQDAAREFGGNILQQIIPAFMQGQEGAAGRRQDAIFRGVPGILGASGAAGQADLAGRQGTLGPAVGFGAGFAPVGSQSKSKGGGANISTNVG